MLQRFYFLLFCCFVIVSSENNNRSKDTIDAENALNNLDYTHKSEVKGNNAEFIFTINNMEYAIGNLSTQSYYFSITFSSPKNGEYRTDTTNFPQNQTTYNGILKMENLEDEGHYFVCVVFLSQKLSFAIASSRFCHLVSLDENCSFEESEFILNNLHVIILIPCAVFILALVVIISTIRNYVYRPRKIEAILKTLPYYHARDLENLVELPDFRRQRRNQTSAMNGSVSEIDNDLPGPNGYDNLTIEMVDE